MGRRIHENTTVTCSGHMIQFFCSGIWPYRVVSLIKALHFTNRGTLLKRVNYLRGRVNRNSGFPHCTFVPVTPLSLFSTCLKLRRARYDLSSAHENRSTRDKHRGGGVRLTARQNWNGLDRVRTGNELGEIEITAPFTSLQGEIPNHRRQRETR